MEWVRFNNNNDNKMTNGNQLKIITFIAIFQ